MESAKRNIVPGDLSIRLSADGVIIVEDHKPNGIVSYKEVSPADLYFSLLSGYENRNLIYSGFLPSHCLAVSMCSAERVFYLWNPELRADVTYLETEYPDFPLPRLIFGIRMLENGKVVGCSLGVVADEEPRPETPMYRYPFSNVYESGEVCTGNNVLPRFPDPRKLWQFPRYLLGIPDNDDFYERNNNRLGLAHYELLEHLKNKDPAYYYTDVLVESNRTLQDFISGR